MSLGRVLCGAFAAAVLAAAAGCKTTSVMETGMAHPSFEIVGSGVKFNGEYVSPWDVPEILERHNVPHDRVVHIRLNELDRLNEALAFKALMAKAGYRRTALVTKEHAESWSVKSPDKGTPYGAGRRTQQRRKPAIRYRSASEE